MLLRLHPAVLLRVVWVKCLVEQNRQLEAVCSRALFDETEVPIRGAEAWHGLLPQALLCGEEVTLEPTIIAIRRAVHLECGNTQRRLMLLADINPILVRLFGFL